MRFVFVWLILLALVDVQAKEVNADQVKVAYTYNFLKHTEWPDEAKLREYHLLVVSKNESLKNLFMMLSSRKQLNDKPIRVSFYDGRTLPKAVQAVYVDEESAALYEKFFYAYESDDVLLISDEYKDRKKVLINLVQNGAIIGFEINKANILNRSLKITPDLVLLGGTEIDVAKLYKSSQDELKEQKEAIANLNQKINDKNTELSAKIEAIEKQKTALAEQESKITFQNGTITRQLRSIDDQIGTIRSQQGELETIRSNIGIQKEQLVAEEEKIAEKEFILKQLMNAHQEKQQEINRANDELESLNEQIDAQKKNLVYKEEVISSQREMIAVLAILASIIIVLAVFVIKQNRRLNELSRTDPLTGLFNRRAFLPQIREETERFERYGSPLCVLLIDVDYFKLINDTQGHNKGDSVLKEMAELIRTRVRRTDLSVRWGGEEFLVMAIGADLDKGAKLAENLRSTVERHDFGIGRQVTVSIGVASATSGQTGEELVKRADVALYEAKANGRNRVEIERSGE